MTVNLSRTSVYGSQMQEDSTGDVTKVKLIVQELDQIMTILREKVHIFIRRESKLLQSVNIPVTGYYYK